MTASKNSKYAGEISYHLPQFRHSGRLGVYPEAECQQARDSSLITVTLPN